MCALDLVQHPSCLCNPHQGRSSRKAGGVSSVRSTGRYHCNDRYRWVQIVGAISSLLWTSLMFPNSLYLIPTSVHPLVRVCIGGDNLLLIYEDRHARLWDVRTQEFWRAMTDDKAEELVGQGGWAEWYVVSRRELTFFPLSS